MADQPKRYIVFFFADLSGGGVERMRLNLAAELYQRGHRVSVVVASRRGALVDYTPYGVEIVDLGAHRTLTSIVKLAKFIMRAQPDVVFASLDHNNIAALIARCLVSFRTTTKIVICQHNALSAELALGWKYRLVPYLYRALAWRAAGIVAVSDGTADDLSRVAGISRWRITRIYNPVVADEFRQVTGTPPAHPWFALQPAPLVFVGRLVPQKDPILIVRALAAARSKDHRVIILGEGPLRAACEQTAYQLGVADRVQCLGFEPFPRPWIEAARALVLTSRYEGFGNVVAEALHCGTPVLATDCAYGPGEILDGGRFGTLVPVGDASALASAIDSSAVYDWDRDMLRQRGAIFTASRAATEHEDLLQRLFTEKRPFGLTFTQADAHQIAQRIVSDQTPLRVTSLVVTPNLDHIRLLRRSDFAEAYGRAALIAADGAPVAWYASLRTGRRIGRVTGCDITHEVMTHPEIRQRRVCFVVDQLQTSQALRAWAEEGGAADRIKIIIAPLNLTEHRQAQDDIAQLIKHHESQIVFLALGAPVSEIFIDTHREVLGPCWALCVGQAVRIELGLVRRAPKLFQYIGCEWLWRLGQDPVRLLPRYARAAQAFPRAVLTDLANNCNGEHDQPPQNM